MLLALDFGAQPCMSGYDMMYKHWTKLNFMYSYTLRPRLGR